VAIVETQPDGPERLEALTRLSEHTRRQLFMIAGESTLAGVLLCVLAVVLFLVARHRRNETQRLQTMMQLTSHQLKTPLAGVRVLLQSLENGSIPKAMEHEMIGQGVAECDRLEHLVETMLAFQRSVVRQKASLERRDTSDLLSDLLAHRRQTNPHESLDWNQPGGLAVLADLDGFRVIVENLLDNTRKYGGGQVRLIESTQAGRWRLAVADQGQGFEPSESERLFEPFERGGGAGVAHGSGLGLYIARQLAQKMNGDLTATSPGRGKGATFTLELPLAPQGHAKSEVAHG
jgi:signal transduction histidine kinase